MNKNEDTKTIYDDSNILEVSEMPAFLNNLALQTNDLDVADKLVQCSIAISMFNYLTEKVNYLMEKGTNDKDG